MTNSENQLIQKCLDNFPFNLVVDFYKKVIGVSVFPSSFDSVASISCTWSGKEVTEELLRESADELLKDLTECYKKDNEITDLSHGCFRASIIDCSERTSEILDYALEFSPLSAESL